MVADYFRAWRFIEVSLTFPVMLMLSYPWLDSNFYFLHLKLNCLFIFSIFPESIRWQLSNGKFEPAIEQIRSAARLNRIAIPEELLLSISRKNKVCEGLSF